MKPDELINLIGLCFNLVGTVFLGIAAGEFFTAIRASLLASEVFRDSLTDPAPGQPIVNFQNLDKGRDIAFARLERLTKWGFFLVALGFTLCVIATPSLFDRLQNLGAYIATHLKLGR